MLLASLDLGNSFEGARSADVADGSDDRGIDASLLSRHPIATIRGHLDDLAGRSNTWHRTSPTRGEEVP
jgi:hypothetical protein